MKKAFLKSSRIIPFPQGATVMVDRADLYSAIFAANITNADAGATLSLEITHCDTEAGTFTPVTDPMIALGESLTGIPVATNQLVNIDIDLLECKRYVKFTPSYANGNVEAEYAVGLGDSNRYPV